MALFKVFGRFFQDSEHFQQISFNWPQNFMKKRNLKVISKFSLIQIRPDGRSSVALLLHWEPKWFLLVRNHSLNISTWFEIVLTMEEVNMQLKVSIWVKDSEAKRINDWSWKKKVNLNYFYFHLERFQGIREQIWLRRMIIFKGKRSKL